jgi:hypothetical protein
MSDLNLVVNNKMSTETYKSIAERIDKIIDVMLAAHIVTAQIKPVNRKDIQVSLKMGVGNEYAVCICGVQVGKRSGLTVTPFVNVSYIDHPFWEAHMILSNPHIVEEIQEYITLKRVAHNERLRFIALQYSEEGKDSEDTET